MRENEARKHREKAHTNLHVSLQLIKKHTEEALDWARSWPNNVVDLEPGLESILTKVNVLLRSVAPPDYVTGLREVPTIEEQDEWTPVVQFDEFGDVIEQ